MIICNVTRAELEQATRDTGDIRMELEDRSTSRSARFRVKLFPVGDARRAYKLNLDGRRRRVNGVSWEGFRDWMRALYSLNPTAEIRAGYQVAAVYTSREQFERTHEETGWVNVGSEYRPLLACENQWPDAWELLEEQRSAA